MLSKTKMEISTSRPRKSFSQKRLSKFKIVTVDDGLGIKKSRNSSLNCKCSPYFQKGESLQKADNRRSKSLQNCSVTESGTKLLKVLKIAFLFDLYN